MAGTTAQSERDYVNWAFFALMAACVVLVIFVDERYLVLRSDPEWRHIAPFNGGCCRHGLAACAPC